MANPLPATFSPGELYVYGPIDLIVIHDSISLVDDNGDIRQFVSWDSAYDENVSIVPSDPLMPEGQWMPSAFNTPGALNPGQGNGTTGNETIDTGMRISEFLPNPIGSDSQTGMDGEWVELVNTGNQTVDLTGWELRSGSGYNLPSSSLAPGEYAVFPLGGESITLTLSLIHI